MHITVGKAPGARPVYYITQYLTIDTKVFTVDVVTIVHKEGKRVLLRNPTSGLQNPLKIAGQTTTKNPSVLIFCTVLLKT